MPTNPIENQVSRAHREQLFHALREAGPSERADARKALAEHKAAIQANRTAALKRKGA
jgi:hypothetical protein